MLISRQSAIKNLAFLGASLLFTKNLRAETAIDEEKLEPFYIPPAPKLQLDGKGINIRTLVRSTKTNTQFSCVEFVIAPKQMGPPPHVHAALDEIMYVTEGVVSVVVENKVYQVKAGGWHLRPRQITHTFWNATNKPARFIDMYFNQNFEVFLEELNFKLIPHMKSNNLSFDDPSISKWQSDLDKRFGITTFFEQRQALIDLHKLKP